MSTIMAGGEDYLGRVIQWVVYPGEPGEFLARFRVSSGEHKEGGDWKACGSSFRSAMDAKEWVEDGVARAFDLPLGTGFPLVLQDARERSCEGR